MISNSRSTNFSVGTCMGAINIHMRRWSGIRLCTDLRSLAVAIPIVRPKFPSLWFSLHDGEER